ncbi:MAG: hypothetical protein IKX84_03280 [Clostridia bacterium]|nr:hypothetical protein [Clostridia bacterium]
MNTLDKLQKLSKLGKTLSRIVFIVCLVGGIFCAVGILSLLILPESVSFGGVTLYGLVKRSAETSLGTCYTALAMGVIVCAGETVLSKLAERYFARELAAGTPFTFEGAKELIRLGMCAVCIPIAAKAAAEITFRIMARCLEDVETLVPGDTVSVGLGVMMIVAGLMCRYGAQLRQENGSEA